MYEPNGFAKQIFTKRYALSDNESWKDACSRVANHVAMAESGDNNTKFKEQFFDVISKNLFMPGGRIWYGCGRAKGQLLNCFVIPTEDSREGWGKTVSDMIVISGTGGGVGINCSPVRPRGQKINGSGGTATGAVSLMEIINSAGNVIKAGGGRRTALMLCLDSDHGDIEEFLDKKLDLKELNNANISIWFDKDPEDFFNAVNTDATFDLKFRNKVVKSIKAKELWDKIVTNALANGEPGLLNGYYANRMSNIWYWKPLISTNPCGEVVLPANCCCCLGALVLPKFIVDAEVGHPLIDWKLLEDTIATSVRFLDDVLSVNSYPLKEIAEACSQERRLGLGIMGLHDMLLILGLKYNSPEGLEFVDKLMNNIKNYAYQASIEIAKEKGSFPVLDIEKFLKSGFAKTLKPTVRKLIRENGIRNSNLLTIAPTGTTSMVCDVTSGIEPMFAPAYERRYWDNDERKMEVVVHPLFRKFVESGRSTVHFQGADDLSLRDHFEMQRVCQRHVDNAVSKCLAAGTLILTDKGLIPIESFSDVEGDDKFEKPSEEFKTPSGDKILSHYRLGFAKATRIRLSNGAELVGATESHRVMTENGWKLMSQLREGDIVLGVDQIGHGSGNMKIDFSDCFKANANRINTPDKMTEDLAEWLGMLASDGHTEERTGCVSLCWKEKDEVKERFIFLSRKIFNVTPKLLTDKRNGVEGAVITSRNLVRFVQTLIGLRSRDKHVPTQILRGSKEEKIAFMRGLTLDGTLKKDRGLCIYAGISYDLAYQASELCRSFGHPNVRLTKCKYVNPGEFVYAVCVSDELQNLIDPIELHKKSSAATVKYNVLLDREKLEEKVLANHEHYSAIRALRQDTERVYCTNKLAKDMGWPIELNVNHVTLVEDAGFVEMYDIEVENSHSYVVNGMISHNTINVSPGTSKEELSDAYMEYFPELKGVTVYPVGSRENQPLTPLSLKDAIDITKSVTEATTIDSCKNGSCDI